MEIIDICQAKIQLAHLVERAARGESFAIAEAGRPMAKVVPFDAPLTHQGRRLGFLIGQIRTPADCDDMASDEIDALFRSGA